MRPVVSIANDKVSIKSHMKSSNDSLSVWPGYVAAIASLVLSMLLLLAVLVFAMTQVGGIVAKYSDEIMHSALNEVKNRPLEKMPPPTLGAKKARSVARGGAFVESGTPLRQIKLRFQRGLSGIPDRQIEQLVASIKKTQAPMGVKWKIWAFFPKGDVVLERLTFNLMLSVRGELSGFGIKENDVDLSLIESGVHLAGYKEGEIIINLAPLHLVALGRINK